MDLVSCAALSCGMVRTMVAQTYLVDLLDVYINKLTILSIVVLTWLGGSKGLWRPSSFGFMCVLQAKGMSGIATSTCYIYFEASHYCW